MTTQMWEAPAGAVAARMRLPDFLILGEMKCGTTTLWEMLAQHPRVFLPAEKELHFFGSYGRFRPCGRVEEDIEPYARLFEPAAADQLCGEATPNYLVDPHAWERIHRTVPDARLLVIVRDPVARAWSHYWHNVRRGREPLTFERAIEVEPQRLSTGDADDYDAYSYLTRGRYVDGLRRYESVFGRDRLCVLTLEELQRDPRAAVAPAFNLLRLEIPSALTAAPIRNRATYPRWPGLDRLTRSTRRVADACGPMVAASARRVGQWTRSWRTYSGTPRMAPDLRSLLAARFVGSDRELADWLGRPLPWRATAERSRGGTP